MNLLDYLVKAEEFAELLNSLDPGYREQAIRELRALTKFCWECGRDVPEGSRCHCMNDE